MAICILQDPHGELTNKNVLIRTKPWSTIATETRLTKPQLERAIADAHDELYKYREKRPRPHLDYKIIVSWNALMISGLTRASRALGVDDKAGSEHLALAERAFAFINTNMRNKTDGSLLRSGYVDDAGTFSTA